jgi:PAS domain S-box-containing protein
MNDEPAKVSDQRLAFTDHGNDIFFAAVSKTRMPMIVTDARQPDNPIVFVNAAFTSLTGYSEQELLGQNCRLLQGPNTSRATIDEIRAALADEREINTEVLNYRKDGSSFWNALFIAPVRNESGELAYFFASQLDVSRRRDAEDALRQAHKMEALGQLTGGIAHDFNNLLQIMSGYADVMKMGIDRGQDTARLAMPVDKMRTAIKRAATLTQQLLAFARKQELRGRVLNLNSRLREFEELAINTLGPTVRFTVEMHEPLPNCQLDASQLESAILNLLLNARDALAGCDEARVALRTGTLSLAERKSLGFAELAPGDYVWVSVSDNGRGIAPSIIAHVMEPFFTTKEEGKGTGLGLSMVYGFARQSGGAVDLYSEEGNGTTVRLYFPSVPYEEKRDELREDDPAAQLRARSATRDEVVLVVDDRPDVAEVAALILDGMGLGTRIAHNAKDALALFDEDVRIDLLFTDLIMPGGMNGVLLAREARRRKPHLPVLLTTGYADMSLARSDADGSEFPILHKPYQGPELCAAVLQALHNPGTDS